MKQLINNLGVFYENERGKQLQLEENLLEFEKMEKELNVSKNTLIKKKEILNEIGKNAKETARKTLQDMSTQALQFILGPNIRLEVELNDKGAEFYVVSEYSDIEVYANPSEEEGGGVADIVAFSIQIAMICLFKDYNKAPLFLDEPSKYVSKRYSAKVAEFIYEMCHSMNRQVLLVTHDEILGMLGDKGYRLYLKDGVTILETIK